MPKDTFHHLNDEKKKKIFDAAVKEFSTRRFSEASLNQIVKTAEIPWGSFYQYFKDKEDIYLYMLEEIAKDKRQIIRHAEALDPDADFFETFIHRTGASLDLSRVKPEYTKIGMLMEMDNSEFITKLLAESTEKYKKMIECDKERGLIKPEIDSDLVLDLISTFSLNEYYRNGLDKEKYLKKLCDAIKIIKEGIAVVKD